MDEYKIYHLTATTASGTEKFKVRAPSEAVAMGMCDAVVADEGRAPVANWTISESRTMCFTHPGCDGADDTHDAVTFDK